MDHDLDTSAWERITEHNGRVSLILCFIDVLFQIWTNTMLTSITYPAFKLISNNVELGYYCRIKQIQQFEPVTDKTFPIQLL